MCVPRLALIRRLYVWLIEVHYVCFVCMCTSSFFLLHQNLGLAFLGFLPASYMPQHKHIDTESDIDSDRHTQALQMSTQTDTPTRPIPHGRHSFLQPVPPFMSLCERTGAVCAVVMSGDRPVVTWALPGVDPAGLHTTSHHHDTQTDNEPIGRGVVMVGLRGYTSIASA
jgi:hypothetical protein